MRYRLVAMAEDGFLIPYPEHNRFFFNRELAQEYIDAHADVIDVIGYNDMVFQSMQKQSQYKREQARKETSGHDVQKSGEMISIDGQECVKVDEWNAGDHVYVVGNSVEDGDFFYASVNGKDIFEYDHKPYRDEVEDDYIDLEAMRDIDRHEAEIDSHFEGGAEPEFYYAISLTSDAYADSYYISVMDQNTGEEIQNYHDSHGDMPTFGTVDEAVDYCHRNGIDFENAAEVDQWQTIEVERANDIDHRKKDRQEPEIDKSGAVNFRITDDSLGTGSAREKFRSNVEAIRTLEKIEGENRLATPEEQKILAQYVGWGGLADAFDESKSAWAGECRELRASCRMRNTILQGKVP